MKFNSRLARLHWYHWSIISLSIALTLFAWRYSQTQSEKRIHLKFDSEVTRITSLVRERLELYESALFGGVAAIKMNNDNLNPIEWRKFSKSLNIDKKYPGISGIGVIYKVNPEGMKQYLSEQRAYRPNYKLHPKHDREEFWPITYIEPVETNKKAVGLDMAHEINRFSAVKKAEQTGTTQITGPIVLVQDSTKTPGFLFYAPFYKDKTNEFIGVVYAPFIVNRLMEGTLNNTNRHVNFSLKDEGTFLFNEHTKDFDDYDLDPLYTKEIILELYGRVWKFDMRSSKSFREASENNQSIFILIFGIVVDSLLFFFFIVLSNSNTKAINYANKVSNALKKSNEELQQFSYRTSHDLVSPLKSISGLVACTEEDLEDEEIEEVKQNLSKIRNLTEKLTLLVGDILDLARADNMSADPELLDFSQIESDINDKLVLIVRESGAKIKFENNIIESIYSQKTRILQIIENLVSNGVKYHDATKPEKWVIVNLQSVGGELIVTVSDNGIGIPDQYQEEVFQMFKRFNPKVSYGSGLGLYLVKKHVDFLDGTISFTSNTKEGTSFIVTLKVKSNKDLV